MAEKNGILRRGFLRNSTGATASFFFPGILSLQSGETRGRAYGLPFSYQAGTGKEIMVLSVRKWSGDTVLFTY